MFTNSTASRRGAGRDTQRHTSHSSPKRKRVTAVFSKTQRVLLKRVWLKRGGREPISRLPSPAILSATETCGEPPRLDQLAPKHAARSVNWCLKTVATRGVELPPCGRNLLFLPWNGKSPRRLWRDHAWNPAPRFRCCYDGTGRLRHDNRQCMTGLPFRFLSPQYGRQRHHHPPVGGHRAAFAVMIALRAAGLPWFAVYRKARV